ncbi:protein kinase domain-containing protein [Nocardiopsis nanhaiensis]
MTHSTETPAGVLPLEPGEPRYLGPFRLVGRLGVGGMGVVYAGLDDRDRRVAVKSVHRSYAADREFRVRFAREVGLVRRVRSTRVPAFVGADTKAAVPWLATEYVPGPTLGRYVRDHGPLDGEALTAFALGVAEALAAIHARGVVHRDLKPGNVILAPDGPKVVDFGIARAAEESGLTRTGGMVGTPGWLAPEQYRGAPATDRSDVFAWSGLVAYAATGRNAFGAGPSDVLASRVLAEAPSLDGVPGHLRGVLERALDKDPSRRPRAAGLRDLPGHPPSDGFREAPSDDSWGGFPDQDTTAEEWAEQAPPKRRWVRRHRKALSACAAVLSLALVAGAGVWSFGTGRTPFGPGGPADGEPAEAEAGDDAGPAAPDGVPAEYRELYGTGTVTVAAADGPDPALVRRLESGSGGEDLDQLRLTFEEAVRRLDSPTSLTLTVRAEYLPDFGSLSVHSDDFGLVSEVRSSDDSLYLHPSSTRGVLAALDPEEPEATFDVTLTGPVGTGSVAYYLPQEARSDGEPVPLDQPGGLCFVSDVPRPEETETAAEAAPHDTTLTDGTPTNSCAYNEGH